MIIRYDIEVNFVKKIKGFNYCKYNCNKLHLVSFMANESERTWFHAKLPSTSPKWS